MFVALSVERFSSSDEGRGPSEVGTGSHPKSTPKRASRSANLQGDLHQIL